MSYELHITRRDVLDDSGSDNISIEEWLSHVDSDPELEPDLKDDKLPQYEHVIYSANPKRWPIWYHSELRRIHTKNPDGQTIGKLVEIVKVLDAKVQGDDGEYYEDDSGYPVGYLPPGNTSKPWWCFW